MNAIKAWLVKFALWFTWSWPLARDVLWPVLKDGRITLEEVQQRIPLTWPRDDLGKPKDIELPWAVWFKTDK